MGNSELLLKKSWGGGGGGSETLGKGGVGILEGRGELGSLGGGRGAFPAPCPSP